MLKNEKKRGIVKESQQVIINNRKMTFLVIVGN